MAAAWPRPTTSRVSRAKPSGPADAADRIDGELADLAPGSVPLGMPGAKHRSDPDNRRNA